MEKNYNELFYDFLCDIDFTLVKCVGEDRVSVDRHGIEYEGDWALSDNQGANLGGIEEDRFDTAMQIADRLDIYIDDYYFESLSWAEFEGTEDLYSCENWVNWYNSVEKTEEMERQWQWTFDVLDLIAFHTEEVDLNEVYKLFEGN